MSDFFPLSRSELEAICTTIVRRQKADRVFLLIMRGESLEVVGMYHQTKASLKEMSHVLRKLADAIDDDVARSLTE
jgi:hypothetical protein